MPLEVKKTYWSDRNGSAVLQSHVNSDELWPVNSFVVPTHDLRVLVKEEYDNGITLEYEIEVPQ